MQIQDIRDRIETGQKETFEYLAKIPQNTGVKSGNIMWKYFRFLVWKEEGVPPAQAQPAIRLNSSYSYFLEKATLLHTSFLLFSVIFILYIIIIIVIIIICIIIINIIIQICIIYIILNIRVTHVSIIILNIKIRELNINIVTLNEICSKY